MRWHDAAMAVAKAEWLDSRDVFVQASQIRKEDGG
jgi:hypothetical protein